MEQTQPNSPSLFQHALRSGLLLGAVSVGLTFLLYVVDYSLLANWKLLLLIIAISLGALIYFGLDYRKSGTGFLTYGKAFQHGFITLAISGLMGIIFNIVLYTVIDPELPGRLTEVALENTEAMMRKFGAPEDQIETALEDARVSTQASYTVAGQLKSYLWVLIFYAIIAAITSAFVKKNEPETV